MRTVDIKELSCPVCSCTGEHYRKLKELTLCYCKHCTHRFTDVDSINNKEQYSEEYYEQKHSNWFNHPNLSLFDYVYSQIKSLDHKNLSVLDVGCGNGDFLRYLQKNRIIFSCTALIIIIINHIKPLNFFVATFIILISMKNLMLLLIWQ